MKKLISILLVICMLLPVLPVFAADATDFEPFKIKVNNTGSANGKRWVIKTDGFPFAITDNNQLVGCTLSGTVTYNGTKDYSKTVVFDKVEIYKSDVRSNGALSAIDFKVPDGYTLHMGNEEDRNYSYDITINPRDKNAPAPETSKVETKPATTAPAVSPMKFNESEALIMLKAEDFANNLGSWTLEDAKNGSLLPVLEGLKDRKGDPVDATTTVEIKKEGTYYVWARALDYAENQPGTRSFTVAVNGTSMPENAGTHKTEGWAWQKLGEIALTAGNATVSIIDSSKFYGRCEALALTTDKDFAPPSTNNELINAMNKYNANSKIEGPKAPTNKLGKAVILFIGNSKAYVLGNESAVDKDNADVVPFIENGRTLVPVRFIAESFGATVGWDDATRTVSVDANGKKISMVLGDTKMSVDGAEVTLDAPANSYNGRTFIPLRAMVEAIGKKVFWDARGLIMISDVTFNEGSDKDLIDNAVASFGGEVIDFAVVDEDLSAYQGTIGSSDYKLDYFNPSELQERDGIPNVIRKMQKGEAVTVAFHGGSITMQDGWRGKTMEWLRNQYPSATFTEIDVSLSGTGADLAACRTDDEILKHNPDLLFVEYAVNGGTQQNMEGIVRKTWKQDNTTDIIFVYTVTVSHLTSYSSGILHSYAKDYEVVADYYGIPSIAFGFQIAELRDKGELTPKASSPEAGKILFSSDGTHPTMDGSILYAGAVARSIATMDKHTAVDSFAHDLKTPLHADNWENAKMYDYSAATFDGNWTEYTATGNGYDNDYSYTGGYMSTFMKIFPKMIGTKTAGSSFTVKFVGTTIGFFDLGGTYAGQLKVTVDGKDAGVINRHTVHSSKLRHQYDFVSDLPYGEHTVTFTLDSNKPNKTSMSDYEQNKAEYDKNEFYFSNILVVGEIIK